MHKAAMELGKKALEWANNAGLDNISDQGWDNLKDCMEAVKNAICADKEYREIDEMDEMEKLYGRMGYRGRDSMGRFVHRSGRGRSAGYTPLWHMMPEMDDMYEDDYPEIYGNYRMGYTGGKMDGMNHHTGSEMRNMATSRRGEMYDRYKDNRRHYTESKDAEAKKRMDESMKEYMDDAIDGMKEMWRDADPQLRQTMKADLTKMVQQLQ